jgi:Holliday junction resolvase-like predicted endonuclease
MFDEELKSLLKKMQDSFYLLYEYESIENRKPTFQSSFELFENQQKLSNCQFNSVLENETQIISQRPKNRPRKNPFQFNSDDLIRLKDDNFYYQPSKTHYSDFFSCINELQQRFDIDEILKVFRWQDYEKFIAQALEQFGFISNHTFRFSSKGKRHEVDIVARDNQKILFIDAKHWNIKTASQSALIRVAHEQAIRALHLSKDPVVSGTLLQSLQISLKSKFKKYKIYPVILVSSTLPSNIIVNGIPILSISRFNEFLTNFGSIETSLKPILLNKAIFQTKLL